ncbi:hypothetical protein BDQ12DRAFT_661522 [Crucibulum laeve]|uniref:Uncharacterized protein n=1 Tax=Crucibulum laeve TaxID=68775 RepID=A0A5C3MU07_9AGAR|nr:hypothetical protein BDQ12DRAFT_661522 [Crucibulum laeve]
MASYQRAQSGTPPSISSLKIGAQDAMSELVSSSNNVAAGIGEVLQALGAVSTATTSKPIMIEYGNRIMALGRKRMAVMSGRNAFLYLKSKFGLLNATAALYLQATFIGDEETFVEVDMDAWEELVPYMHKLRIII